MARILIVEDEGKISRFLELELTHEGYQVEVAANGRQGLEMAMSDGYDLIVLDLMLPELNGMEVLRRLRAHSQVPVIMLTAKDQVMDKVMGLDSGADDYMTKPFAIEELLARIRGILKRRQQTPQENGKKLVIGKIQLDREKYQVTYETEGIELTKREFELLLYLMENADIVLTRERILEAVWGYDYYGDTNVVDVYIRYLRSKIDERFETKLIHTIRGVGYLIRNERKG